MFWSLTMGILRGAELYTIALVVVANISIAMLALAFFRLRAEHPSCSSPTTIRPPRRRSWISSAASRCSVCAAKTVTPGGVELTVEGAAPRAL